MVASIYDLTDDFKHPGIAWDMPGRAFRSQFADAVQALRVGLYVSLYANPSTHPIYDRNGPGKILVNNKGHTLKYGKCEQGIADRHRINHRHFHRRPPARAKETGIFRESLQLLLALDLSSVDLRGIKLRVYETYWNRCIRAFLERESFADPAQDRRSESRYLVGSPPTKKALMAVVSGLRDDICAAAKVRGGWKKLAPPARDESTRRGPK